MPDPKPTECDYAMAREFVSHGDVHRIAYALRKAREEGARAALRMLLQRLTGQEPCSDGSYTIEEIVRAVVEGS